MIVIFLFVSRCSEFIYYFLFWTHYETLSRVPNYLWSMMETCKLDQVRLFQLLLLEKWKSEGNKSWMVSFLLGGNASRSCGYNTGGGAQLFVISGVAVEDWVFNRQLLCAPLILFCFVFQDGKCDITEPHLITFTQRRLSVSTKSQKRNGSSVSVHLLPHSSRGCCTAVF